MHIAIDDTYGPGDAIPTKYVTGARRTYVALEFPDDEADEARRGIAECLASIPSMMGVAPTEFHFADIYNRRGVWSSCPEGRNLQLFEFFAQLYQQYKWRVHVQTVDERTFADHGANPSGDVDGIDLGTRDGQALLLLLLKVREGIAPPPEKLVIRIDEGNKRPGANFASVVFRDWEGFYDGKYSSSTSEPLLQIADFFAFSINRSTHIQLKAKPTNTDMRFLNLIGTMDIFSSDLKRNVAKPGSLREELDKGLLRDRINKGLE